MRTATMLATMKRMNSVQLAVPHREVRDNAIQATYQKWWPCCVQQQQLWRGRRDFIFVQTMQLHTCHTEESRFHSEESGSQLCDHMMLFELFVL